MMEEPDWSRGKRAHGKTLLPLTQLQLNSKRQTPAPERDKWMLAEIKEREGRAPTIMTQELALPLDNPTNTA